MSTSTVTIDGTSIGGNAVTCLATFLAAQRALDSGDEDYFVHADGEAFTLVRLHLSTTLTARIVDDGTIDSLRDMLMERAADLLRDIDNI
jgi:hypothetical protein